ncbi:glycosyltransferase family 4 protein [Winogradskyella sp. F6397]|uniref:Glycosyltransferase family 4 protein n=1 Tax=Winogradskyella marina TaxID=2785530 RepID=A0ABS0ELI7_9FLAO|nr:glycosyltransferase family 4 protein [Winogradskyella marina]MBF8150991.1 glycosyltransferase family 4 protein [Winogradskyella marina]
MHICFITNEFPKPGYPHGGIGTFIATLSKVLVEKGIEVSVVGKNYTASEEIESINGVKVYRLYAKKIKGLEWYFNTQVIANRIKAIHLESPIDIVEASDMGLAFLPKLKGVSYVIRMHGGHHFFSESENRKINPWRGFQEKRSYKSADAFVAVSDFVKTHTSKYLSLENRLVERINYPINLNHFQPIEVPVVPNQIVFAGTVCEKKGIRQLIQAMAYILEEFPTASLDICGRDWFYPNGDSYIEMLKATEIPKLKSNADSVTFKGVIDYNELPKVYAAAHVCAFPSHMETLGLVAPEAMCMMKPVLFTKEGPGPEVISHCETGLLCNPYDALDIAEQIKWIFKNAEAADKMGVNARKSVLERFNINSIVEQNITFYNRIINSNKSV